MMPWKTCVLAGMVLAAVFAAVTVAPAQESEDGTEIPKLSGDGIAWDLWNQNALDYGPFDEGPKPMDNDPAWPHVGNLQPGVKTHRIADLTNPILTPWAIERMRPYNEEIMGTDYVPFVSTSLCWPNPTPSQVLVPTNTYFLQTPDFIIQIWERDHHYRTIWLNAEHSEDVKPSWYGESIGHYEGTDTLVIDTIGVMEHRFSFLDNYRTPHSDQLHTVEEWKMQTLEDGSEGIFVTVTVEDPIAFTTPWKGWAKYRKFIADEPMPEIVCMENNPDYFGLDLYHPPEDTTPDF